MLLSEVDWKDFIHVYPIGDVVLHNLTDNFKGGCHCDPKIDFDYKLVIHDAMDGRPGDIGEDGEVYEIVPPVTVRRYSEIFGEEE